LLKNYENFISLALKQRLYIIPPLLLLLLTHIFTVRKTDILPSINLSEQHFSEEKSHSKIINSSLDSLGYHFSFVLGDEIYPTISAGGRVEKEGYYFDLKNAETLLLELTPKRNENFNFTLLFDIEKFTIRNLNETYGFLTIALSTIPGINSYKVDFSSLQTPLWWYTLNRTDKSCVPKIDLSRCVGFSITPHDLSGRGEELSISIKKLSVIKRWYHFIIVSLPFLLIYTFLLLLLINNFNKKYKSISLKKLPIKSENLIDLKILEEFLSKSYHESGVTQDFVSASTGLSHKKVRTLLKESYEKTLKQFVTDLKMQEAKRLLSETNRTVIEISQAVGFIHISTFNHQFKNICGTTPTKFRKFH
jgi:AraC-like DNA-binding protein